jgi:hypothetical protein
MNEDEAREIEERLRRIRLKPAAPGLRKKILDAAERRKEESALTTPLLRRCLAGCAVMLTGVFLADGLVSRSQTRHLQVLLDGSRPAMGRTDEESRVLAEVLGGPVAAELLARSKTAAESRERGEPVSREEILKQLLREDFDASESKENHR